MLSFVYSTLALRQLLPSRRPSDRRLPSRARWRSWLVAGASVLAAQPLFAQSRADTVRLSLAEARTLALEANPDLLAARLDTAIARGMFRQAGVLRFNPSADVLAARGGSELEAGVSQEIEVFGQRSVRLSAGRAGFESARARVANAARITIGVVDRAFYRLVSATQRTELARNVLALNERLADVAQRQLAEGEISRLDLNLTAVELGRARARTLATRREREQAVIELGRLIGITRGTPIHALVDSAELGTGRDSAHVSLWRLETPQDTARAVEAEQFIAVALARRPDLAERTAAIRRANAELSLSGREALPNPILRGVFERPTDGSSTRFRPGIGVSLPFLNRRQGERQALRAAARQAELEYASLTRRVSSEVAAAVATYHSAVSEVEVLAATVLAPARQNRQLAEIAYREGEIGLPVLLLIQNQAIDAELDYWATWLVAREALATLAEATGENVQAFRAGRAR